jgi:hypothetical protein
MMILVISLVLDQFMLLVASRLDLAVTDRNRRLHLLPEEERQLWGVLGEKSGDPDRHQFRIAGRESVPL